VEEHPGDEESNPNNEAKEADEVNHRQAPHPFFPELPEVGHQADGEEGQDEEDAAKRVRFARRCLGRIKKLLVPEVRQPYQQHNQKGAKHLPPSLGLALP